MKFRGTPSTSDKPCPVAGCESFPFATDEDVAEHIRIGDHAFLAPSRWYSTPPRPEQTEQVKRLLAERAGDPVAEGLRALLNRKYRERRLTDHLLDCVVAALGSTPLEHAAAGAGR